MNCVLTVQIKKYGAITACDLLHEGRLVASLIKEKTNFVDYSRKWIFEDLDTAIEFYVAQAAPDKNSDVPPRPLRLKSPFLIFSQNRFSAGSST